MTSEDHLREAKGDFLTAQNKDQPPTEIVVNLCPLYTLITPEMPFQCPR